jgi:hypothetical protein
MGDHLDARQQHHFGVPEAGSRDLAEIALEARPHGRGLLVRDAGERAERGQPVLHAREVVLHEEQRPDPFPARRAGQLVDRLFSRRQRRVDVDDGGQALPFVRREGRGQEPDGERGDDEDLHLKRLSRTRVA